MDDPTTTHRADIACTEDQDDNNYFVSAYPPFSCWSSSHNEQFLKALAQPAAGQPLTLYTHLPFCARRCEFCYYLSYAGKNDEQISSYIEHLAIELTRYSRYPAIQDRLINCAYFGGGTPSILSAKQLNHLFHSLQAIVPWSDHAEVTFECAPKSVTAEKLRVLKDSGVTRISMGVQSMDDEILTISKRIHSSSDVRHAYELIKTQGFDEINLDLISGLPGQTDATFSRSLQSLIELGTDSITVYLLEIPMNTPLHKRLARNTSTPTPADWKNRRNRLQQAYAMLEKNNYTLINSYTAVKDPSKHRFEYQRLLYEGGDMLGLGASSFSYIHGVHAQNATSMKGWLKELELSGLPLSRSYALSRREQFIREFILQLKLGGVHPAAFIDKFGMDPLDIFADVLKDLTADGLIKYTKGYLGLTYDGLLRVDRLLPLFYASEHQNVRYS